ncbi:hypothetical protein AAF712_005766 [Marasmius tenuissimus]|uniref:Uncharacterized protein n=1 Tax=Marasmius tenuissimus TaxID=585030 RepID=A0ABR3A011_9AGAR|nr:hypothetical protein PM082_010829 [Marasmius tenuissimus]
MKTFLQLAGFSLLVRATLGIWVNHTVDDTNSTMIKYQGSWPESRDTHRSDLDYGGSHMVSSVPGDKAVFKFTGVAVYYLAPLWPYAVSTSLCLDGTPAKVVNLTDPNANTTDGGPETTGWAVRWSATNLSNTTHTLTVSIPSGALYVVVDGFMYTAFDPTPAESENELSKFTDSASLPAVLGAILASLTVIALVTFCLCYRRRKRRAAAQRQASRRAATNFLAPEFGTVEPFGSFMASMPGYTPQTYDRQDLPYAAVPIASPDTPSTQTPTDFTRSTPLPTSPRQEYPFPHTEKAVRMSFAGPRNADHLHQENSSSGHDREFPSDGGSRDSQVLAPTRMSFASESNDYTPYKSHARNSSSFSGHRPESTGGSSSRQSSQPASSSRPYSASSGSQSEKPPPRTYIDEKRLQMKAVQEPPAYTK